MGGVDICTLNPLHHIWVAFLVLSVKYIQYIRAGSPGSDLSLGSERLTFSRRAWENCSDDSCIDGPSLQFAGVIDDKDIS